MRKYLNEDGTGKTQSKVLVNYTSANERIVLNLKIHAIYISWPTSQKMQLNERYDYPDLHVGNYGQRLKMSRTGLTVMAYI